MQRYVSTVMRSTQATVEVSKRKRQVRALWSTDEGDHYRTAFCMSGIDTSAFDANPVQLWEHGKSAERGTMPVANALEYGPDRYKGKNVFIGTSRFWDDEFSDRLFDRYASGQLRGWSINVLPLDAGPPTHEERRARPDWANLDTVYRSTRLLEVSATSLPGNPSTLTLSVERSLPGAASAVRCPQRCDDVLGLLADVDRLRRRGPDDGRLRVGARLLGLVLREWADPRRRELAWVGAAAVLGSRGA